MSNNRQIKLGFSMKGLGYHASAWMDPEVPADGGLSYKYYLDMTRTAESGLFDLVFMADYNGIRLSNSPKGVLGRMPVGAEFEPVTLLSALSQATSNIGLVATASTTFHQPYQLARVFSSLDHLSEGRAGWNVVTSSRDEEARNFGGDQIMEKGDRYERAHESLKIAFGLWASWDRDAFPRDKNTGVFFDPEKMHLIKHEGKHFKVHGPLNLPQSPQGRPVIIQAGASEKGVELAASKADVIYAAQNTLEEARAFYSKVRGNLGKFGREQDEVVIMPGILPVIGDTTADAKARYRHMQEDLDHMLGLENLAPYFGDLSELDPDSPVPDLRTDRPYTSRGEIMLALGRRNNWSIRQLYQSTAIGNVHHVVVGSPGDIADVMEQWFTSGAADGFNVLPAKSPASLREFVARVVPELQRRGLFRTAYESRTLRGNLGLPPIRPTRSEASAQ